MMLFIKVVNGTTMDHPVFGGNLLEVFGNVPEDYKPFVRTEKPPLGMYEVDDETAPLYVLNEHGVWTDAWARRPMTAEERIEKEAEVIADRQRILGSLIRYADEKIAELEDAEAIAAFEAFKQEVEKLEADAEEHFDFPLAPMVIQGKLMPPITNSGSKPEMIG